MSNYKTYIHFLLAGLATWFLVASCATSRPFTKAGVVQQIESGKDGYTASLRGRDGQEFDALVSRVRMQQDYRVLRVGERVKVAGDTTHLNQRLRVLVKQIR